MKRLKQFDIRGKGGIQSGDPMTTWFNTFSIICYLNYYLKDLPLPKDVDGFIDNTSASGIRVSGDDQLIFVPSALGPTAYSTLVSHVGPDRK